MNERNIVRFNLYSKGRIISDEGFLRKDIFESH